MASWWDANKWGLGVYPAKSDLNLASDQVIYKIINYENKNTINPKNSEGLENYHAVLVVLILIDGRKKEIVINTKRSYKDLSF
jgi:hypothetical protein